MDKPQAKRWHGIIDPTDERVYMAIDLKSFYASVECVERGLNPLQTNLVVADKSRTEKTICLAVSPSLKAYGISGRARLFEVVKRVREVNLDRLYHSPRGILIGTSTHDPDVQHNPEVELDYIVAPPRMSLYMQYSTRIYNLYLRHISPDDIHVYSVDEVFIDATPYLKLYGLTPHELAMRLVREVLNETGITATAGIGSNMYLAKVAMDIVAKHLPADADGVRIAELNEQSYRQQLWNHTPLTDFWRVGRGISRKLNAMGLHTMGDVARQSVRDEEPLYRLFGVAAELLIDHAWGWEPCTMKAIKSYRPSTHSLTSSQVLSEPYSCPKAEVVVREMMDSMILDLVAKGLVTDSITLDIGYDTSSPRIEGYPMGKDHYGRTVPLPSHGSARLSQATSAQRPLMAAMMDIFERIHQPQLLVRRVAIGVHNISPLHPQKQASAQLSLFDIPAPTPTEEETETARRMRRLQEVTLDIQRRFGKNALLKGTDFDEGATTRSRNQQIGGHHA